MENPAFPFRMFTTRVWYEEGLVLLLGPPGTESNVIIDHVLGEAKKCGHSTRKALHRLDKLQTSGDVKIVRVTFHDSY